MYGHPILVNIAAVTLTIPSFFKHLATSAKDEVVELKKDIDHAVVIKKGLIKEI